MERVISQPLDEIIAQIPLEQAGRLHIFQPGAMSMNHTEGVVAAYSRRLYHQQLEQEKRIIIEEVKLANRKAMASIHSTLNIRLKYAVDIKPAADAHGLWNQVKMMTELDPSERKIMLEGELAVLCFNENIHSATSFLWEMHRYHKELAIINESTVNLEQLTCDFQDRIPQQYRNASIFLLKIF